MSDTRQPTDTALDPESTWIRQRLRALRNRYPGLALRTQLTHIHDDQVVVRAELTLPDGSSVSAYAAEPSDQSGLLDGAIELAEGRATARALDLLGLGELTANATGPEPAPDKPVEAPARPPDRSAPPVVDALRKATQRRPATEPPPPINEVRDEPRDASPAASRPEPVPEARREPEPTTAPSHPAPPTAAAHEPGSPSLPDLPDLPDLADYTWTHFWTWARANDLSTKGQVEQRIGRPIDNLTPRDVRQLLHDNGVPG